MKKFSKKGVLLFAAAMALCAFVMPSMASASNWSPVGTEHTLDSQDLGFINDSTPIGPVSSMCSRAQFTMNVASAAIVEITAGSFTGCQLAGAGAGACTATSTATSLPWTATAVSTSNIQIHGVNINVFVENNPGSTACGLAGGVIRITGTLSGGRWLGDTGGPRAINIQGSTGLVSHSALGTGLPITPTGTITDTQNTLTVTG